MKSNDFPTKLTKTMLVLILNGDNPISIKDYGPIALFNVLYKIMANAITNRLRGILHEIISPA
jgi:hypothetical protein